MTCASAYKQTSSCHKGCTRDAQRARQKKQYNRGLSVACSPSVARVVIGSFWLLTALDVGLIAGEGAEEDNNLRAV